MGGAGGRTALVLVDGEHYPPVIRATLAHLAASGTTAVAALFLGGTEKVERRGEDIDLGVPVRWVAASGRHLDVAEAAARVRELLEEHRPDVVVDLSDEPILDHRRRCQLASHVLLSGVPYEGPDFRLWPPPRPRLTTKPTVAVIGCGKRTGKTGVTGELARRLLRSGRTPVLVAMGRGGPPDPVLVPAGTRLDVATLLDVADRGGHAASDFYEDAVTTGATTVGARRCGGGLAGGVASSNVAAAVAVADAQDGDVVLLEGSGAAIPPAHADATVTVVAADADPEFVRGYLGPYRILLADALVVTMAEPPRASPVQVEAVLGAIRSLSRRPHVLLTVFRPEPLGTVSGAKVFFATTAPSTVSAALVNSLETRFGCEVVATSSRLADRPALRDELHAAPAFDVLLVELKAAAVDVAARTATARGARVVFCDNRPVVTGVDEGTSERFAAGEDVLDSITAALMRRAEERFARR